MKNIFDIYNKSNLIIQSFELSEVLNKNGEYKKQALYLPIGWQKATKSNININVSGHLLLTGHKINDKYVIGIDIDNKEGKDDCLNGLTFWKELINNNNFKITTPTQKTGNNGFHYLFLICEEQYKNISNNITDLKIDNQKYTIDVKCTGGCLYVEPSKYVSLETGETKKYKWIIKPEINNFQDLPNFLYEIIYNYHKEKNKPKEPKKIKKIIIRDDEEEEIEENIKEREIVFNNIIVNSEDEKLIYLLDPDRFIDTQKWFNIGIIMKSLNFSFELYSKLSKEHYKEYNDEDCLKFWNSYKIREKYDIKLLHFIARKDNPNEYENLNKPEIIKNGRSNYYLIENKLYKIKKDKTQGEYYSDYIDGEIIIVDNIPKEEKKPKKLLKKKIKNDE